MTLIIIIIEANYVSKHVLIKINIFRIMCSIKSFEFNSTNEEKENFVF